MLTLLPFHIPFIVLLSEASTKTKFLLTITDCPLTESAGGQRKPLFFFFLYLSFTVALEKGRVGALVHVWTFHMQFVFLFFSKGKAGTYLLIFKNRVVKVKYFAPLTTKA